MRALPETWQLLDGLLKCLIGDVRAPRRTRQREPAEGSGVVVWLPCPGAPFLELIGRLCDLDES
jgi:hypothetical protein